MFDSFESFFTQYPELKRNDLRLQKIELDYENRVFVYLVIPTIHKKAIIEIKSDNDVETLVRSCNFSVNIEEFFWKLRRLYLANHLALFL